MRACLSVLKASSCCGLQPGVVPVVLVDNSLRCALGALCKIRQDWCEFCVIVDELRLVVDGTEETLELLCVPRGRPIADDGNVLIRELHPVFVDNAAKVLKLCVKEVALLGLEGGTVGGHACKDMVEMCKGRVEVRAKDDNVVEVDQAFVVVEPREDHVVHPLEEGDGVGGSKRKTTPLVLSHVADEGGKRFGLVRQRDLPIAGIHVKSAIELFAA